MSYVDGFVVPVPVKRLIFGGFRPLLAL